jgi:hypothetical protein
MNSQEHNETAPLPGGMAFSIAAGWALNRVLQIDDAAPGFVAHVCRARLTWRQTLWAALSVDADTNPAAVLRLTGDPGSLDQSPLNLRAEFGRAVLSVAPRDLSEIVFGSCPDGWLGSLRKLHGQPLDHPESYAALFGLLASSNPLDHERRAALLETGSLDESMICAVLSIRDPNLITPTIVQKMRGSEDVARFEAGVTLVRRLCSWAGDEDIRRAASQAPDRLGRSWLRAILAKADRPCPEHHPCDADPDLERVAVRDAKRIGQEFQNCLEPSRILPKALSGVWALVVWHGAGLLIDTRMDDAGVWHVERVHRRCNARVESEHLLRVRERLEPLGVRCFVPASPNADLASVGRIWGGWEDASFAAFEIEG